jgi:two-component system LytT family sensor kinase
MDKTHKNSILIITVSAILVAILFNIKLIFFILDQFETQKILSQMGTGERMRIYLGSVTFAFHILLFCITAFFNYSWKDKFIHPGMNRTGRILSVIFINMLIFYGSAFSEHMLISHSFEGLGKRMTTVYFLFMNFSISGLAISEAYFIILLRKIKTAELENIRLREEKSNAELAALKEQISPHFFFNTLNTLSSVIRTEKKSDSLEFVDNLSQVYRYILESHRNDLVKIKDEIQFINAYFFLLGKRFAKKLILEIDMASDLLKTSIPPMSLQLLVENAIHHNTMTRSKPLKIRIYHQDENIVVQNNLQKKKSSESMGIGLPNLLQRYQLIARRDIIIHQTTEFFTVKLPVIK